MQSGRTTVRKNNQWAKRGDTHQQTKGGGSSGTENENNTLLIITIEEGDSTKKMKQMAQAG